MNQSAVLEIDHFVPLLQEKALKPRTATVDPHVWRVIIADADRDVHHATLAALGQCSFLDRSLEFLHAYTRDEAQALLQSQSDIAVILLDVRMERDDPDASLIATIRLDLGLRATRIVLRTGQPGEAPELSVIREHDINDYRTKAELTSALLVTTFTAAIRSYHQLCTLAAGQRGLDLVARAGAELFARNGLEPFVEGMFVQIGALLGVRPEGVVCITVPTPRAGSELRVLGAAGRYRAFAGLPVAVLRAPALEALARECLEASCNRYTADALALYLGGGDPTHQAVALVSLTDAPGELQRRLLDVFSRTLATGLDRWIASKSTVRS